MDKLTNEEIARVFHSYHNCEITAKYDPNGLSGMEIDKITGISEYGINTSAGYLWDLSDCKLLLTPLDKISDEHAIEIAKIEGMANSKILVRDNVGITIVDDTYEMTLYYREAVIVFTKNKSPYACNQSQMFDKLRELGYALPYKGKSLFELGLAIDKSK